MPPCAATVCDRVGNSFEIHAVFRPASAQPMAARRPAPPAPTTTASYSWSTTVYLDVSADVSTPDRTVALRTAKPRAAQARGRGAAIRRTRIIFPRRFFANGRPPESPAVQNRNCCVPSLRFTPWPRFCTAYTNTKSFHCTSKASVRFFCVATRCDWKRWRHGGNLKRHFFSTGVSWGGLIKQRTNSSAYRPRSGRTDHARVPNVTRCVMAIINTSLRAHPFKSIVSDFQIGAF